MLDSINLFPAKIKLLRTTYGLSLAELADVLSIKNTSLYAWENGSSSPLFENLLSLSAFFSVSLDWLAGYSKTVYTEESVVAGEKVLHEKIRHKFLSGGQSNESEYRIFLQELQQLSEKQYVDLQKENWTKLRSEYYSLSVRANLTVFLHLVPLANIYWAAEYIDNGYKKRGIIAIVKEKLGPKYGNYKEPGKKAKERAIRLVELLSRKKNQ